MTQTYTMSLFGGILIGLSATIFLVANGRIAGISGLLAGLIAEPSQRWLTNNCFLAGLLLGPVLFRSFTGDWPLVRSEGSIALFVAAGLLVGFGTRLGSGCTSGHGVCASLGCRRDRLPLLSPSSPSASLPSR